jgi:hypothetical protein
LNPLPVQELKTTRFFPAISIGKTNECRARGWFMATSSTGKVVTLLARRMNKAENTD